MKDAERAREVAGMQQKQRERTPAIRLIEVTARQIKSWQCHHHDVSSHSHGNCFGSGLTPDG